MKRDEVPEVPPWVRHFLVFVVKRCCCILIAWIDTLQESQRIDKSQCM